MRFFLFFFKYTVNRILSAVPSAFGTISARTGVLVNNTGAGATSGRVGEGFQGASAVGGRGMWGLGGAGGGSYVAVAREDPDTECGATAGGGGTEGGGVGGGVGGAYEEEDGGLQMALEMSLLEERARVREGGV